MSAILASPFAMPFFALVGAFGIYLIETALYYSFNAWYYRWGPTIVREEWQTAASPEDVRQAIRPHLGPGGLVVGRESREGFCLRQRVVDVNTWPRILLRISGGDRGAILGYEVRPFFSMGLLLIPMGWLAIVVVGRLTSALYVTAGLLAFVFAAYKWLLPLDVRRIKRLRHIRHALAGLGLRVCEDCGYDLFGHEVVTVCPECGWKAAQSLPSAKAAESERPDERPGRSAPRGR